MLAADDDAIADIGNFPNGDVDEALHDRVIRALVDRRYPDGNPYLTGEREA